MGCGMGWHRARHPPPGVGPSVRGRCGGRQESLQRGNFWGQGKSHCWRQWALVGGSLGSEALDKQVTLERGGGTTQ